MNVTFPKLRIAMSDTHGVGVFAEENIKWGMPVTEYLGERISKKESARREKFYEHIGYMCIFELDDFSDLDGIKGPGNARFVNHSTKPNCVPVRIEGRIIYCAIDAIKKGSELFIDYGFDPSAGGELRSAPARVGVAVTRRAAKASSARLGTESAGSNPVPVTPYKHPGRPRCIRDYLTVKSALGHHPTRRYFIKNSETGRSYEKRWRNYKAFVLAALRHE